MTTGPPCWSDALTQGPARRAHWTTHDVRVAQRSHFLRQLLGGLARMMAGLHDEHRPVPPARAARGARRGSAAPMGIGATAHALLAI